MITCYSLTWLSGSKSWRSALWVTEKTDVGQESNHSFPGLDTKMGVQKNVEIVYDIPIFLIKGYI